MHPPGPGACDAPSTVPATCRYRRVPVWLLVSSRGEVPEPLVRMPRQPTERNLMLHILASAATMLAGALLLPAVVVFAWWVHQRFPVGP